MIVEWIFFFAVLFGMYCVGYATGRVREMHNPSRPRKIATPKPICEGCEHHLSFHAEGKRCHELTNIEDTYGQPIKCGCRQYIGPERLTPDYLPAHE